jgi:hypothetical protein
VKQEQWLQVRQDKQGQRKALTKLGTYIVLRRVWNPIEFQGQRSKGQIFTTYHPCEHSRINILQWMGFQILLRSKYAPRLVKIHWRMLILECSQGCYAVKIWPGDIDLWPWKLIGFQVNLLPCNILVNTRINILQWILTNLDTYLVLRRVWDSWFSRSKVFQTLLRSMYVPCLVKIHWSMLILECSQGCYAVNIQCGRIMIGFIVVVVRQ